VRAGDFDTFDLPGRLRWPALFFFYSFTNFTVAKKEDNLYLYSTISGDLLYPEFATGRHKSSHGHKQADQIRHRFRRAQ
jgi:hypothetical protein